MTKLSEVVERLSKDMPNLEDPEGKVIKYMAKGEAASILDDYSDEDLADMLIEGFRPYKEVLIEWFQDMSEEELNEWYATMKTCFEEQS